MRIRKTFSSLLSEAETQLLMKNSKRGGTMRILLEHSRYGAIVLPSLVITSVLVLRAYENKQLLGWACLSTVKNQKPKDFQIWVLPEHRRKGVGSRLLKAAHKEAHGKKMRVYEVSGKAYNFYAQETNQGKIVHA